MLSELEKDYITYKVFGGVAVLPEISNINLPFTWGNIKKYLTV